MTLDYRRHAAQEGGIVLKGGVLCGQAQLLTRQATLEGGNACAHAAAQQGQGIQ